jgi:hypothetical protein
MICRLLFPCPKSPCNYMKRVCLSHFAYSIVWKVYLYHDLRLSVMIARRKKRDSYSSVFHSYSTGTPVVLHWYSIVLHVLLRYSTGTPLVLHWYSTRTPLVLHRTSTVIRCTPEYGKSRFFPLGWLQDFLSLKFIFVQVESYRTFTIIENIHASHVVCFPT